jgi:transposase
MKKKIVTKQVVGIDIGKDSFFVCYMVKNEDESVTIKGTTNFENNISGFEKFHDWSNKRKQTTKVSLVYVMEATGVYYEELAYFLHEKKATVSVQLAQKLKYYAKSCNLKSKNDKLDAKMIASFGIEKNLHDKEIWTPPSENFKVLRDLSREHTSLKHAQVVAKSQLHALKHAHGIYEKVKEMKLNQISFYQTQIKEVTEEMRNLIKKDEKLNKKISHIETVAGLGFITIIKVITEVNGFLLFKNIRQLVSYAGLDVVEDASGKHVGKTKISKKGNARIRTALYMPAMSAIQNNQTLKQFYNRVNEGRTVKKQGLIAVMRKLLILIYTLWKKEEDYIENYQAVKSSSGNDED